MKVEQIYTGCLAEATYFIQSSGEALVIDPLRETAPYIKKAKENNVKIKYIFLTHFHADFVSGHVDLAKKSGATIVFGPNATADFDFYSAKDNEEFKLGKLKIKLLHTPGHTMESSTYLLHDENGNPHCIFTGDTLFIGDVGRPDLAVKSNFSEEDLAGLLYDSLRNKIMPLDDNIIVYPAHGAGSACGKNMSKETFDTLGNQKLLNYALKSDMSKTEFIKELTTDLAKPPKYFPKNVLMNQSVNVEIDSILKKGTIAIDANSFSKFNSDGSILTLDCRTQKDFSESHIPNSLFIGLNGAFAPWVGTLISDINQSIILVCPEGKEEEAVTRLARIGYDNSIGFLHGGIQSWIDAGFKTDSVLSIQPSILEKQYNSISNLIDIRKPGEYNSEHIKDIENLPLDSIYETMDKYNPEKTYHIHCQGGYRSMIASSILKANGIHNVIDIAGGFKLIKDTTDLEMVTQQCSSNK